MALYIGLMSGTSMDGIDAALVELPENKLICGITKKYSQELITLLNHVVANNHLNLSSICNLNSLIGREFAGAVADLLAKAHCSAADIVAIGSHGQTVCHDTTCAIPYTLQLGCGHTISSLTGIPVVADFRTRDLVNGGQGAPFAPLYHQKLCADRTAPIAVVNIGGISNISFITPNEATRGWDVGPGNCLMDAWINQHQGASYDADGCWAAQGQVLKPLLDDLLADPFFKLPLPKSIGKEYFSLAWLSSFLKAAYGTVDVQTTLTALTAYTIAQTCLNNPLKINELYLCGGGTHNLYLYQTLSTLLPEVKVLSIADIGVSPDYLEAMMFAWLAEQTIEHKPLDLSAITGSLKPAILGAIYPVAKSY